MHKHTNMYYSLTTPAARCAYIKWVDRQMLTHTGPRTARDISKYLRTKLSNRDKARFASLNRQDPVRSTRTATAVQRTLTALRSMVT